MNPDTTTVATDQKVKTLIIHYVPALGLPPETLESVPGGRAGYHIHSDENGNPAGYRLYVDRTTILVPLCQVQKIVAQF